MHNQKIKIHTMESLQPIYLYDLKNIFFVNALRQFQ